MAAALGDQWEPYRRHARWTSHHYSDWFTYFQRGPRKVLRCVGRVTLKGFGVVPCAHEPPVSVDMSKGSVSIGLSQLHMDHTIPKHVVCQHWKRAIARYKEMNGGKYPSFSLGCCIEYIDYLLYSVVPDSRWGLPLVRPRCAPREGSKCHVQEAEHLQRLGMNAIDERLNVVDPGESISKWLFGERAESDEDEDDCIWI
mgnify:CR=1 FL=1